MAKYRSGKFKCWGKYKNAESSNKFNRSFEVEVDVDMDIAEQFRGCDDEQVRPYLYRVAIPAALEDKYDGYCGITEYYFEEISIDPRDEGEEPVKKTVKKKSNKPVDTFAKE